MLKPDQVASEIKKGVNAKIADGRSLYLVVRGGRGYWVHEYRDGKVRRSRGLGSAATVSPAAARRARDAFAVGRRNGAGVAFMTSTATVPAAPAQAPAVAADNLFGDAHSTYRANHAAEWRPQQRVQIARLFKNHTAPLDGRPVHEITCDHVADVLRPIWRGPSAGQGARLRQLMERVFRAAKVVPNPASWDALQDVLSRKTVKAKAHASMAYQDLPAFMVELANATTRQRKSGAGRPPSVSATDYGTVSRCLRFTILTAVRSGEAINADWSEFDLAKREWTVPAARMKMDEPHTVPLSDATIALLGTPKKTGRVFTVSTTRSGAIPKTGLYNHLMDYRPGLTVHGFRSSFATWAEEAGHKPNVIEAALAHAKGDATTRAYLRSSLLLARRKLMADWAQFATSNLAAEHPARTLSPDSIRSALMPA
jgi:integrase